MSKSQRDAVKGAKKIQEPCPQCNDIDHFRRVKVHEQKEAIHEEAMKIANEHAITWANSDEGRCSLSWHALWMTHFQGMQDSEVKKIREKRCMDQESAAQKHDQGDRNKWICSQHGEFR